MNEEEFNKQYDAAVIAGKRHKLQERTNRLQFFVDTFEGRWNYAIEVEAYLILESHQSRHRAIWRYIRFALWNWRVAWLGRIHFYRRYWWYRLVKRYEPEAAFEAVEKVVEAEIFGDERPI